MQPLPVRFVQSIRLAFKSSRPLVRHKTPLLKFSSPQPAPLQQPCRYRHRAVFAHLYSTERDSKKEEKSASTESEALQSSKDEAASKSNVDLPRGRSPEPPKTDPNFDTSSTSLSSSSSFESLPSQAQSRRTELSKRFSHLMDNVQANIFVASQRLNDLTGYSGIEALKKEIEAQEATVQSNRAAVREARATYAAAVATRSATQREVNDLLQRKHKWSPTDLERFTSLYRSDHANEQAETEAQEKLGRAERAAEEASSRLARTILARYHEEQIWSDKIRQMSTWGTWGLMGLNVLLFIVFQIVIEPWRRRRLVKGFEEKVMEALEREAGVGIGAAAAGAIAVKDRTDMVRDSTEHEQQLLASTASAQADVESAIEAVVDVEIAQEAVEKVTQIEPTPMEELPTGQSTFAKPPSGFAYCQEALRELFSEKTVLTVTQKQLTTVALEGVAAGVTGGAALMCLLFALLRQK